jgi:Chromosome segregation ATPases
MGFGTVRGKGKALKSLFLRPLQSLEVGLLSLPIVLLLGEVGCLSLISSVPLVVVLGVIGVSVALVSFFRNWGYGIAILGAIFLGISLYNHSSISIFWGSLLVFSFVVSLGVFLLSVSLVEGLIREKTASLKKVSICRDELQESYNREVQERKDGELFFQGQVAALERELSVCSDQLQEVSRKYTHAHEDLQVLIDQRDGWLNDYMTLHQEYVRAISGYEEQTLFPWRVFQGHSQESVDDSQQIQVCEKLADLEKLCEEESGSKRYAEERLEKVLSDLLEATHHRESLEKEVVEKDKEIEALKQEISMEKLQNSSAHHERAVYKGKYLQLREQFQVKDAFLKKARRERFLAQEQLLALKREEEEEASDPSTMDSFFIIQNLLLQIEALEEEINYLEELVFHNQNL